MSNKQKSCIKSKSKLAVPSVENSVSFCLTENAEEIEKKCPICIDIISDNDRKYLPCTHKFHIKCIDEWIKKNIFCPLCRIPIFITSFDQYEKYKSFKDEMNQNEEFQRTREIPVTEHSLSLMFIREPSQFTIADVDEENREKFRTIMGIDAYPESQDYAFIDILNNNISESESSSENEMLLDFNIDSRIRSQSEADNLNTLREVSVTDRLRNISTVSFYGDTEESIDDLDEAHAPQMFIFPINQPNNSDRGGDTTPP